MRKWSILIQRFSEAWRALHGGTIAVFTYVFDTTIVHNQGALEIHSTRQGYVTYVQWRAKLQLLRYVLITELVTFCSTQKLVLFVFVTF